MPVKHFKHKGLKQLFNEGRNAKVAPKLWANALLILDVLDAMHALEDVKGVKDFHPLKGNRKGYYSMHVNGNYCITFTFDGKDVNDINLEDYH